MPEPKAKDLLYTAACLLIEQSSYQLPAMSLGSKYYLRQELANLAKALVQAYEADQEPELYRLSEQMIDLAKNLKVLKAA